MDPYVDLLRDAGQAAIRLFAQPYIYIAILIVYWHARQGSLLQRKLFHVRLYGALRLTMLRVLAGAAVGIILSVAGLAAGAKLTTSTLLCVWIAMGVMAILRLRYICLAYAAGILGVLQAILQAVGTDSLQDGTWSDAVQVVSDISVPSLLFLAGVLHIGEGILVRLQSAKQAIPLFLEGKRGKPMGAFALSGAWPIPLLWLVPASGSGIGLPWTPLFGMTDDIAGWSILAFPVLIGFSDRTWTQWPEAKARTSGNLLMLYGILIAGLAAGAEFWSPLTVVAAIAAFVLHEALLLLSRRGEEGRSPIFGQDGSGVRVLAVLPGTPAQEMGFQSGEIIKKVNGAAVRTKEELHSAFGRQSAFSKLEVINREGHVRFVQRARYEGEHYQLGLILAPDEDVDFVAAPRSASLWQGLRQAGSRRRHGRTEAAKQARKDAERAAAELAASTAAAEAVAAESETVVESGLPPRAAVSKKKS
ncbi:serine protease [Cohnella yongneupensis]|uniref:Serine protease n=1 Tax=Cohnella yongneupensis TaxID=425006 RepID=A0ABW0QY07_9BACL